MQLLIGSPAGPSAGTEDPAEPRRAPTPAPAVTVDPADQIGGERREPGPTGAWVFTNMVAAIDGAATLDGRSGGLGGAGDRAVFSALRAEADVIVVGAATVRAENYRLTRRPEGAAAELRRSRGQQPQARLCIVTRGDALSGATRLSDELPQRGAAREPWQQPLVATVEGGGGDHGDLLEVLALGDDDVDLEALIAELADRGLQRILCEGGPSLLGQLAAADLVDEWNFTIAPSIVGGTATRPVVTPASLGLPLLLDRLMSDTDSALYARYLTIRS